MQEYTLVGHRGYPAQYPENTMVGFEAAVSAGATWLETDVQFSQDFQPMLYHDATLQRTSGHSGAPWDFDADELQTLGAAEQQRWGDRFAGEPIPTLQQFVEWALPQEDLQLMVELKNESIEQFGIQPTVDEMMYRLSPILPRCTFISMNSDCLVAARRWKPYTADYSTPSITVPIGWVLPEWNQANQRRAEQLAPDFLFCDVQRLPFDKPWWDGPWQWVAYTVDDAETADRLARHGAVFVETNDIGKLFSAR